VTAAPSAVAHPITRGLAPFEIGDEVYSGLDLKPDVAPLLSLAAEGGAAAMPGLWVRTFGAGRVVYLGLGHDAASIRHPTHATLLRRAAVWAMRMTDDGVEATR
jgi:type 1 glutamine amidotransferase